MCYIEPLGSDGNKVDSDSDSDSDSVLFVWRLRFNAVLTGRCRCRVTDPAVPVVLNRLDGLVVRVSASRAEDPGFESRLRQDFSGSSHARCLAL